MGDNVLKTELCDMLGIEYPIIQAGMGCISGPELTAAVSNAGGLGFLGAAPITPDELEASIKETKKLTDKPFGVDFAMMQVEGFEAFDSQEKIEAGIPDEHKAFMEKIQLEWGVKPEKRKVRPFTTAKIIKQFIELIIEEKIPYFASAVGNPGWAVPTFHEAGIKVFAPVGNVKQARGVAKAGVDFVIAQGYDAGGHTGQVGTMSFIPQAVDAVSPIPVIGAGGIADGRGIVGALGLGAIGVWMGTAFLLADECFKWPVEFKDAAMVFGGNQVEEYKQMIIDGGAEDSSISRAWIGYTGRSLTNKLKEAFARPDAPNTLHFPFQYHLIGEAVTRAREENVPESFYSMASQAIGLLNERKSAKQIIEDLLKEARESLDRLGQF